LRRLGISAAALPFALNLPSLSFAGQTRLKQRLVIVFSPNGVVPGTFWPDSFGEDFAFKESLTPLELLRKQTLILHGVCDKVRGDGDNHMRGIGCLLTGTELFPGNVQGGSDTPAGWASGLSIDQEIANYLQTNAETRTRFGSLEFGVMVPDHADTWTRMVYAGPNKPIEPIDSPYQMFGKLYGRMKDRESLGSVLDDLQDDFKKLGAAVSGDDRKMLEEHAAMVRDLETELRTGEDQSVGHEVPVIEPGVREENDDMPKISKLQIELMVNSFAADFARVATLQFTNSVGQAKMHWLDVQEGHHELSHHEDSKKDSQEKLTRINRWYCEQIAYLAKRLAETPEPGSEGSMLDHTLIVWTNELGKGNDHSLDNIPFVMVGGGLGFRMGRAIDFPSVPHNRLWLSLAQAFGHDLKRFGNPDYCGDGVLTGLG
jgi:hypothetical protein